MNLIEIFKNIQFSKFLWKCSNLFAIFELIKLNAVLKVKFVQLTMIPLRKFRIERDGEGKGSDKRKCTLSS